jgi:hypothetical protein
LIVSDGLIVVPEVMVGVAEAIQRRSYADSVVEFTVEAECLVAIGKWGSSRTIHHATGTTGRILISGPSISTVVLSPGYHVYAYEVDF